jgi:hypothetical protein
MMLSFKKAIVLIFYVAISSSFVSSAQAEQESRSERDMYPDVPTKLVGNDYKVESVYNQEDMIVVIQQQQEQHRQLQMDPVQV